MTTAISFSVVVAGQAEEAVRRASDYFARHGMGMLMFAEVRLRQARLYLGSQRLGEAAAAAVDAACFLRIFSFGFIFSSSCALRCFRLFQSEGYMCLAINLPGSPAEVYWSLVRVQKRYLLW